MFRVGKAGLHERMLEEQALRDVDQHDARLRIQDLEHARECTEAAAHLDDPEGLLREVEHRLETEHPGQAVQEIGAQAPAGDRLAVLVEHVRRLAQGRRQRLHVDAVRAAQEVEAPIDRRRQVRLTAAEVVEGLVVQVSDRLLHRLAGADVRDQVLLEVVGPDRAEVVARADAHVAVGLHRRGIGGLGLLEHARRRHVDRTRALHVATNRIAGLLEGRGIVAHLGDPRSKGAVGLGCGPMRPANCAHDRAEPRGRARRPARRGRQGSRESVRASLAGPPRGNRGVSGAFLGQLPALG